MRQLMEKLYERVKHGDEKHREWLWRELRQFADDVNAKTLKIPPTFDPVSDVREFSHKFGLAYDGKPRFMPPGLAEFRRKFLVEETSEYKAATFQGAYFVTFAREDPQRRETIAHYLEHAVDALVDLTYVAIGNAEYHGFDFRESWRRVHEANMRKERATAETASERGGLNDVVKPSGWQAPSHADLVADHAHQEEVE